MQEPYRTGYQEAQCCERNLDVVAGSHQSVWPHEFSVGWWSLIYLSPASYFCSSLCLCCQVKFHLKINIAHRLSPHQGKKTNKNDPMDVSWQQIIVWTEESSFPALGPTILKIVPSTALKLKNATASSMTSKPKFIVVLCSLGQVWNRHLAEPKLLDHVQRTMMGWSLQQECQPKLQHMK